MLVIGAKSRTGSYARLSYRLGFTAIGPAAPTPMVYPSGAAWASALKPMTPLPPPLLSMMTGCPSRSVSFWPTIRAMTSLPPPGGKGTIRRIALLG